MKDFIWKASKRALPIKDLYDDTYQVFYIPESIVPKLCKITSFEKDPAKFAGEKVKVKMVTEYVAEYNKETGFVIEEGAEYIIPLYYNYLAATNCGNDPIFKVYKSVSLEDGEFSYVPGSDEATEKLNDWCKELYHFAENEVESALAPSKRDNYKISFDAEVEDAVYVGKTLDVKVSEDMTVAEFKEEVKNVLGVIPNIFLNQKEVKDPNALLKSVGVKGKTVIKVGPYLAVGDVNRLFKEQLKWEGVEVYFKFAKRPWSYMMGDQLLSELDNLPSIWKSIQCNVAIKIVNIIKP